MNTHNFKVYYSGTLAGTGTISADGEGQQRQENTTDVNLYTTPVFYGGGFGGNNGSSTAGPKTIIIPTIKDILYFNTLTSAVSSTIPTQVIGGERGDGNTSGFGGSTTNNGGGCVFLAGHITTFTGIISAKGNDAGPSFSTGGGGGVIIHVTDTTPSTYTTVVLSLIHI